MEPQPYFALLRRVLDAFDRFGEPLPRPLSAAIALAARTDDVAAAERALAPFVLLHVEIGAEGFGVPRAGQLAPALVERGWRSFLVRVANPRRTEGRFALTIDGPVLGDIEAASSQHFAHQRQALPTDAMAIDEVRRARLIAGIYDDPPMDARLAGVAVEYRIAQFSALAAGRVETGVTVGAFPEPRYVWAPAQKARLSFVAQPTRDVALRIRDADGTPCVAALTVRDASGRLYPDRRGRIAPDLYFQDQVYRSDGETLRLPDGSYRLTATRGPEYLPTEIDAVVSGGAGLPPIALRRWIDPAADGWYSGDVHVHAAGCAHYNDPTVGVGPETMARHAAGEGLWVADVLTWGPGWEVQGRNFTGRVADPPAAVDDPDLQSAAGAKLRPTRVPAAPLLRYDVEVSGFPSSQSGHLILLRLREQDYPGARDPRDWPSWSLPILRWAKAQGAITGFAHCGLGLADLEGPVPSLSVPSFDSIGANEYLVDVAHDAVDFLAGGDTIPAAELTLWYHALNCGFRTAFAGETDWPCMSDGAVGAGRTYARLDRPPAGDAGYGAWVDAVAGGRCYMGDGRAHVRALTVDGVAMGGELRLRAPGRVRVAVEVAARLDPETPAALAAVRERPSWLEPRWHLERARLPGTRSVPVELVVNGRVAATRVLEADGAPHPLVFDVAIDRSSWIAVRVMPSLHTNPVFCLINGAPVRAAASSADWCLASLAKLATTQLPQIATSERSAAREAYDFARRRFERIRAECRR